MANLYFERYGEQAAKALESPMTQVSNSALIEGIEDIGGVERTDIAHAVPIEAALVAQALRAAGVNAGQVVERSPIIPVRIDEVLTRGWYLGKLVGGAPYVIQGSVRREEEASAMLTVDGIIYAYSPYMAAQPIANGVALNRYAPVCATSMNDRAMLYGLAVLANLHDLDINSQPAKA